MADIGIAPPTINSPPIPEIIRQSKVHATGGTAMVEARPDPFRLQRNVILVMLLAFVAAAWAVVVWRALNGMDMTMAPSAMVVRMALFVAMSAVMMMVMMLPSATPAILAYHKVQAGKQNPMMHSFSPGCSWRLICWCGGLLPSTPERWPRE
jgi:predicted metal-binding membrane protein